MKTAQEWEQEFDILYNSINSNVAPALDSYEKSVLLTMAQEQVVKALYTGSTDGGFEASEQTRRFLNNLVCNKSLTCGKMDNGKLIYPTGIFKGYLYELPNDLLFIIQELLSTNVTKNNAKLVIPTTHDEIYKVMQNPFKAPSDTRALRLDVGSNQVEIIGGASNDKYIVSYLRKPYPIILEDLSNSTDFINGTQVPHKDICELDESLHREILTTAISLAQSIYLANSKE